MSSSALAVGCLLSLATQFCCAAAANGNQPTAAQAADPEGLVQHGDGPLAARHFVGTVPATLPVREGITLHAMTETELRYVFRYDGRLEDGQYVASLAELRTFAVFVGRKSWASGSISTQLLDHEQGHFDITETFARRAQQHFDKLLAGDQPLSARGSDEAAARQALREQILKELRAFYEAAAKEHARYDQSTRHGTRSREQQKYRQDQREILEELPRTQPALQGEPPDASSGKEQPSEM